MSEQTEDSLAPSGPEISESDSPETLLGRFRLLQAGNRQLAEYTGYSFDALHDLPLQMPLSHFENNPLCPYPADPYNLSVEVADGQFEDFTDFAWNIVLKRFAIQANKTNISVRARDEIIGELKIQHMRQLADNAEGFNRLRASGAHVDEYDNPGVVPRIRTSAATSAERLALLGWHSNMDAIEDMRFTRALDNKAQDRALHAYMVRLNKTLLEAGIDFRMIPKAEQEARLTFANGIDGHIRVGKAVVAEAYYKNPEGDVSGDKVIEFVSRSSYYYFPTSPQLQGVPENLILMPDGTYRNRQTLSRSVYIRIKASESEGQDDNYDYTDGLEQPSSALDIATGSIKRVTKQ